MNNSCNNCGSLVPTPNSCVVCGGGCVSTNYTNCIILSQLGSQICTYTFDKPGNSYTTSIIISGITYNLGVIDYSNPSNINLLLVALNNLHKGVFSATISAGVVTLSATGDYVYGTLVINGSDYDASCSNTYTNCLDVNQGDTLTDYINAVNSAICEETSPTWTTLTPLATDYQNGNNPLAYTKSGKTVKIKGTISKITSTQNAGVALNLSNTPLPANCCPDVTWSWYKINNLGYCVNVFITNTGYIQIKPLVNNMTSGAGFDVNIEFTTNS